MTAPRRRAQAVPDRQISSLRTRWPHPLFVAPAAPPGAMRAVPGDVLSAQTGDVAHRARVHGGQIVTLGAPRRGVLDQLALRPPPIHRRSLITHHQPIVRTFDDR